MRRDRHRRYDRHAHRMPNDPRVRHSSTAAEARSPRAQAGRPGTRATPAARRCSRVLWPGSALRSHCTSQPASNAHVCWHSTPTGPVDVDVVLDLPEVVPVEEAVLPVPPAVPPAFPTPPPAAVRPSRPCRRSSQQRAHPRAQPLPGCSARPSSPEHSRGRQAQPFQARATGQSCLHAKRGVPGCSGSAASRVARRRLRRRFNQEAFGSCPTI